MFLNFRKRSIVPTRLDLTTTDQGRATRLLQNLHALPRENVRVTIQKHAGVVRVVDVSAGGSRQIQDLVDQVMRIRQKARQLSRLTADNSARLARLERRHEASDRGTASPDT